MSPSKSELIEKFDSLSDDQIIPDDVAAVLCNQSPRTMRRNNLIPRIATGLRSGGRRVADVRALTRGELTPPKSSSKTEKAALEGNLTDNTVA